MGSLPRSQVNPFIPFFTGTTRLQEPKRRSKRERHAFLLLPPNRPRRKHHRSLHSHLRPTDPRLRALYGERHPPPIIRSGLGLHGTVCHCDLSDYGYQGRERVYEYLRVSLALSLSILTRRPVFRMSNANDFW